MSGFKNRLDDSEELGRFKNRIILALFIILALVINGWDNVQNDVTIHVPPDLRSGASLKGDGPPDESVVYLFALNIFQQLNYWKSNGAVDFPDNINKYGYYLTPGYRHDLKILAKSKFRAGELTGRARTMMPVPGVGYDEKWVIPISDGVWLVWIDAIIQEHISGELVKNIRTRYPIKVVSYDINRIKNPWGLALDGNKGYKEERIILEKNG